MKDLETIIAHAGEKRNKMGVSPPICQSSLFTFDSYEEISKAFDDPYNTPIYSRGNNPTVRILEEKVAAAAGGEACKFFSSGMAAISSAILHYIKSGDHIITIKNIYGPANNFLNKYLKEKFNVEVTFISGNDIEEFKKEIKDNTKLFYLESPSSAIFSIQNLKEVVKLAKSKDIKTILDNTCATFVYQRSMEIGIDLEVHSASKYLSGHSDVVAGCVIGKEKDIKEMFYEEFSYLGGVLGPFDAWLILRGLRTLPIRLKQHSENALKIALFLEKHPKIKKVNYVGLESFPQHNIAKETMTGFTGLMSFEINTDVKGIKNFINTLEIFSIGVSWGGYESLAYAPIISILKEMPEDQIKSMGVSPGVIRISIGLESSRELILDLERALNEV